MNIKSFNLVVSTILLIPYAVKADAALETTDASGTKCSTKLSLCELDPSKLTSLGLKGDKGDKGDIGPKGETGSCVCRGTVPSWLHKKDREIEEGETDDGIPKPKWGTRANPGTTTCKDAPIDKSGTYYVYNSMEVECNVIRKTTCVVIKASPGEVFLRNMKPCWLSSAGLDYRDIYNLTNSQLRWLQERSDTASMKIRYNCVDTSPARKDREVQLLTWNDVTIGRSSNASSPLHYEVEYDGCSTAKAGYWAFTDIVIKNTAAHRLPIIDFYVQDDLNKEEQQHKIEVTELCFH